jgi:hypothetical protein
MKVRNAIKKVKSHFAKQGIDIEVHPPSRHGSHRFTFEHNGYVGSFLANGHNGHSAGWEDAETCNFHVRRSNDHNDLHTDYFAGSFRDNITQVCKSLLPDPPKYPAGSLVRGKQKNKRATRQGYAGKVGLVMSAGDGYAKIAWVGEKKPAWGWTNYSERDLELAT